MANSTPNGELARWRGRMEGHQEEQGHRLDRVQGTVEETRREVSQLRSEVGKTQTEVAGVRQDVLEVKQAVQVSTGKGMSWADRIAIGVAAMAMTGGIIAAIITTSGTP